MSKQRSKIKQSLKDLMNTGDVIFPVTVKSIDEDACTIDVETAEGMEIFEVKLRAVKTEKYGCIIFPKKYTTVQICRINDDNDYLMLHADEVEKIYWKIEDMTLEVTKDGFVFNGGDKKGMVLLEKTVERLNKIEQDINNLKTAFSGWSPVSQDGGAALKVATGSWFGQQLVKTVNNDIENTKIKQ